MRKLSIAHVASEMAPLVKVGGLGDVVSALAREQVRRGHRVLAVLPHYASLELPAGWQLHDLGSTRVPWGIGGEPARFRIAEEDLRLRGGGEILGTRQSGMPGFRIARLEVHADLMEIARDDARLVVDTDPNLTTQRGAALRNLLYLFGRDDAIRLFKLEKSGIQ